MQEVGANVFVGVILSVGLSVGLLMGLFQIQWTNFYPIIGPTTIYWISWIICILSASRSKDIVPDSIFFSLQKPITLYVYTLGGVTSPSRLRGGIILSECSLYFTNCVAICNPFIIRRKYGCLCLQSVKAVAPDRYAAQLC